MASPPSPESVAAQAATGFDVLECFECADAVRDALLANGYHGEVVELRSVGRWRFMICLSFAAGTQSITQNGRHVGVRVNGIVFDNLHPSGVPFSDWLADFDAPRGVRVESVTSF